VERLGQVVVCAEAQAFDLVLDPGESRKDEYRGPHLAHSEGSQHLVSRHVWQVEVEHDDVVVVQLAEIDALLAEVRRIDVKALGLEHEFDGLRCRAVVLD